MAGLLTGLLWRMAPRKTQHEASAATRRTGGKPGASAGARSANPSNRKRPAVRTRDTGLRRLFGGGVKLADVIPLRPEFAGSQARRPRPAGKTCEGGRAEASSTWWTLPVAVLMAIAVFGFAYYPVMKVQYREYRERARLAAELKAITARNTRLSAEVARLRTPEGVEDYARTRLGLVKRGEHVVVVRDGSEPATRTAMATGRPRIDSDRADDGPAGPWTSFLDVVFGVQ